MRRSGVLTIGSLLLSVVVVLGVSGTAAAHARRSTALGPRARSTAPMVNSIVPDHGPTGGGTTVTIKGRNIVTATAVNFGSSSAGFSIKSQNQITAISPSGSGTVDVTVTTPEGTSAISSADQFTYSSSSTIQSLSPRSGATTGGTRVTISGSGLTGTTSVDFGSTPAASFTVDSDIAITAVTPAESPGRVDVTVSGPNGSSPIDPADQFTFALRVPTVTSVTPDSGPASGGTQVVITGSQYMKRGTTVDFGSTPASSITVLNSKTIMAVSPAGSGTVDVTVTDAKGTSSTGSADQFTYS